MFEKLRCSLNVVQVKNMVQQDCSTMLLERSIASLDYRSPAKGTSYVPMEYGSIGPKSRSEVHEAVNLTGQKFEKNLKFGRVMVIKGPSIKVLVTAGVWIP